jgi:hypothetical protein
MIVNTAPNGRGGIDALVEMKLAAIEAAPCGSVRPKARRWNSTACPTCWTH